jgi:hypothetical protein
MCKTTAMNHECIQTADHKAIFTLLVTDAKTTRFTGNTDVTI